MIEVFFKVYLTISYIQDITRGAVAIVEIFYYKIVVKLTCPFRSLFASHLQIHLSRLWKEKPKKQLYITLHTEQ